MCAKTLCLASICAFAPSTFGERWAALPDPVAERKKPHDEVFANLPIFLG
jgi:hypothetical protein